MTAIKKCTLKRFKEVCEAKAGNITEIAKALNVTRNTIYTWMKSDNWKDTYNEVEESILDLTESQLLNLIKGVPKFEVNEQGQKVFIGWAEKPSEAAIFFKLKTKGKKRGYIERAEIDHTTGGDKITFSPISFVKSDDKT